MYGATATARAADVPQRRRAPRRCARTNTDHTISDGEQQHDLHHQVEARWVDLARHDEHDIEQEAPPQCEPHRLADGDGETDGELRHDDDDGHFPRSRSDPTFHDRTEEGKGFAVLCGEKRAELVAVPPLGVDQLLRAGSQPSGCEEQPKRQEHHNGEVMARLVDGMCDGTVACFDDTARRPGGEARWLPVDRDTSWMSWSRTSIMNCLLRVSADHVRHT